MMKYLKWPLIGLVLWGTFALLGLLQNFAGVLGSLASVNSQYFFASELLVIGILVGVLIMEWR